MSAGTTATKFAFVTGGTESFSRRRMEVLLRPRHGVRVLRVVELRQASRFPWNRLRQAAHPVAERPAAGVRILNVPDIRQAKL